VTFGVRELAPALTEASLLAEVGDVHLEGRVRTSRFGLSSKAAASCR
jgi:hypothetical protein